MPVLKEIAGPEPGREYHLDRPRTVLGRHPDCDVIIEAGAVSRHHAAVVSVEGEFFVEDLKSRNGTFVNDQVVHARQRLDAADRVQVCDVTFEFHWLPSDPQWSASTDSTSHTEAVLVDDERSAGSSTIMSRYDVSQEGSVHASASASDKLNAILEVSRNLGLALSLDEVLPQLLDSLFKIFRQADRGFIVLRREDGTLEPRWTKIREEGASETIRVSRTIVNRAMESREALLSADAASDERFEMSQSIADFRIRSVMCAPLITSEGEILGVLQVDTLNQKNRFQPNDLEVMASLGSQAAIAIHNAQLHDRTVQQERIERELDVAQQVQKSFLPQSRPQFDGYRFFDYYQPANQIGGDYFDYVNLPDGRMAVIVADVVGHGVAAALLMAKLSSEVRFCLVIETEPRKVVERLNAKLCKDQIEDRFITLILAVIDPHDNEVTIVNAGHMAPLRRQAPSEVEEIDNGYAGIPLGIIDGFQYQQRNFDLQPGEIWTLYTDGVNEASNSDDEQYGLRRVRERVAGELDSPEAVVNELVADVKRFVGDHAQSDDMCLVSFGRN